MIDRMILTRTAWGRLGYKPKKNAIPAIGEFTCPCRNKLHYHFKDVEPKRNGPTDWRYVDDYRCHL